jgi:cytochrome bd-type quinol oxidase subunit 1
MEVVTAFFVEAGFIGILLYGEGRVKHATMFISTVMVSIGTILSTTWILIANSWMQTPGGFAVHDGQFVPSDWIKAIFTPAFVWRWPHMLLAVLISAAFFIAGISAYYLIKGRSRQFAIRSLSIALGVAALLLPAQLLLGDGIAGNVLVPHQISKIEALEGNWGQGNTGWVLFAIPDQEAARNEVQVSVPCLGSFINKDPTCHTATPGLDLTPKADRPNMAASFWGFRAMFYASLVMYVTVFLSVVLRLRIPSLGAVDDAHRDRGDPRRMGHVRGRPSAVGRLRIAAHLRCCLAFGACKPVVLRDRVHLAVRTAPRGLRRVHRSNRTEGSRGRPPVQDRGHHTGRLGTRRPLRAVGDPR